MTDALDMSIGALYAPPAVVHPVDEWLMRRMHSFGASEMGALAIALGRRVWNETTDTKKIASDARLLFARKARAKVMRLTPAVAKRRERDREQERACLAAWVALGCPGSTVDPDSVVHVSGTPEEWLPLRDIWCPRMSCTPDASGRDMFLGLLLDISVKTTWATVRPGPLPWNYEMQAVATMGPTASAGSIVLTGLGYARDDDERGGFLVERVERNEGEIEALRQMCREGWTRVEEIKGGM